MKCCDDLIEQLIIAMDLIRTIEVELTKRKYTDPDNNFIINGGLQKLNEAKDEKIIALSKLRNHVRNHN